MYLVMFIFLIVKNGWGINLNVNKMILDSNSSADCKELNFKCKHIEMFVKSLIVFRNCK